MQNGISSKAFKNATTHTLARCSTKRRGNRPIGGEAELTPHMANGKTHKAAGATLQKVQPCFHGPNAASNNGQASITIINYFFIYTLSLL
jgi:hypothetical protein